MKRGGNIETTDRFRHVTFSVCVVCPPFWLPTKTHESEAAVVCFQGLVSKQKLKTERNLEQIIRSNMSDEGTMSRID